MAQFIHLRKVASHRADAPELRVNTYTEAKVIELEQDNRTVVVGVEQLLTLIELLVESYSLVK
jgi:hypothetical protein